MLEIRLLGQFDLRLDGRPVDIPSRPAQALVAYLLLRPGTAYRREKLAGLLWPDATEPNARGYLRQALWRLRKILHTGAHEYLLADDLTVTFDLGAEGWLDIAELEREGTASTSTESLLHSVSVYQGEFLPGVYSEWTDLERGRLQAVYENKMGLLLDGLVAERRWPETLEWAERWIALGHVPEPAYRALMRAHHAQGDRAGLAASYQRCVETLRRELGVEPSAATRSLYTQLSQGEPSGERSAAGTLLDRRRRLAAVPQGDLPRHLSSFVGREQELAAVKQLLAGAQLVTLTGVGGCGKTRLALQVCRALQADYPQGVWFVELAPVTDPAFVPQTVAAVMGVLEEPGRPILTIVTECLRTKTALLVLDNCEHLVQASAAVAETLLRACPRLHILASSREALGIAGETVYRVPSLSFPDGSAALSPETLLHYEAVRLFVDRAGTALPGFSLSADNAAAVVQICQRLDGIPLAIELAAARVKMLHPGQIASRLSDRFRLLTGGSRTALPRQQTLRATMDWSYNLLAPSEREMLCRLSVFVSGWTLEAAEEICRSGASDSALDVFETLTQLVNKSLVVAEEARGVIRYRLLETIRHYASEKLLDLAEGELIRQRHLAYFLALTQRAAPQLTGPDQVAWLNALETELDNLRAALEWAVENDISAGLQLASGLGRFWDGHDHSREGSCWLMRLLESPAAAAQPLVQAWALGTQGMLQITEGEFAQAQATVEAGLALFRAQADQPGEAFGLLLLGQIAVLYGDYLHADLLLKQSLALYRSIGHKVGQADALTWLGVDHQDFARSRTYLEESLAINREVGHWAGISDNLTNLAQLLYWEGDYVQPAAWLDEAMRLQRQLGSQSGIAWVLEICGNLALHQGDYERARVCYDESIALSETVGYQNVWPLANRAYIALRQGEAAQAHRLFADSLQRFQAAQIKTGVVYCVEGLIRLALQQAAPERAVRLLGWADATRAAGGDTRPASEQAALEKELGGLPALLGGPAYAAAYAAGQALTLEAAIACALEPPPVEA